MHPDSSYRIMTDKVSHTDKVMNLSGNNALHEDIEIKCFYEGTATLLVESQTIHVKAGDVVVINPYEFHATVNTGEERGKYHLFMLPLDYFSNTPELDLHKLLFAEDKRFQTLFTGDEQLHGLLMKVAQEVSNKKDASDLMIRGLLMAFFAILLRKGLVASTTPEKSELRLYSIIEPALRCIKNQYQQTLTVDELAKLCNVSKHYFCRVFKAVTQKSAMEYLRDFRLRVANVLLVNTGKSISQISASCGFENPNYFSRCYKKYYGRSPRQRRNGNEKTTRMDGTYYE